MIVRLRYTKHGKVRFTSHRDVARVFERAVRRAQLPVAYSEGFSPRAKLSFGLALATGYESDAEFLDVELDPERGAAIDVTQLPAKLTPLLPDGISVSAAVPLPRGAASLQQVVTCCEYLIDLLVEQPDADYEAFETAVIAAINAVDTAATVVVPRDRKGVVTEDDIRPGVLALEVVGSIDGGVRLRARLAAQPRSVRPSDVLCALGLPAQARVRRTHQWIELENLRTEPLPADQGGARESATSSANTTDAVSAATGIGPVAEHLATALVLAPREEPTDVRTRGLESRGLHAGGAGPGARPRALRALPA